MGKILCPMAVTISLGEFGVWSRGLGVAAQGLEPLGYGPEANC